ncbi:MAG: valine--tRNA ligase [Actinobacteria bacterium]|nr:valine--tRNA ligase [Actinomycetota bacterium]
MVSMSAELPKKYHHQTVEEKWQQRWSETDLYRWDPARGRSETFSVDTPPPTVSGSLHIGHVFSYTQTDVQVRYQRMRGKNICYPMGWDDNGLPTERRVQHIFGIQCDPTLPYDPTFVPERRSINPHEFTPVSRQNFIDACQIVTQDDEKAFEQTWRKLGLSVDWSLQYATINDHCRHTSQASFLDLVEKKWVYNVESPGMWDVDFQTAVAQAEIEDREKAGAYHHIRFDIESGGDFVIATTRPELLAACIAVVAHPDDPRYQDLFGQYAITPLFGARVPILPADHAEPDKGTGILMVCTFGDAMDVAWWKQSELPIKQVIQRNGSMAPLTFGDAPFDSTAPEDAQRFYDAIAGTRVNKARRIMAELLDEQGRLAQAIEPTQHPVKFYEKGDSPIEFVPTRQWFVSILPHQKALLAQGRKIKWHPPYMLDRYENWVSGLNQDWCISRQRFFGVPFPVWYPLDAQGEPQFNEPLFASPDQLPMDPLTDVPAGYTESQRGQANGFMGDPDVMDTWATSSLTPQLISHWHQDQKRHQQIFPMDIRPQSHEIIRTWAFYTIVKAWMHDQSLPWHHVVISGWVLDPDRKKMSKSKGNVVTPEHLLDTYSSDAIRYWSAKARLGADTAYDETVFTIGKKLVTKVFNASKFVMLQLGDTPRLPVDHITMPLDQSYVASLRIVIQKSTTAFEALDYASAIDVIEAAFWEFCDYYIELVKTRAYKEENTLKRESALATLEWGLSVLIRLLAPFLPFVTEEIWSWRFADNGRSIHVSEWPSVDEVVSVSGHNQPDLVAHAKHMLSQIRGAKSQAQTSMKHPVQQLNIGCDSSTKTAIELILEDLYRAGSIDAHEFHDSDELTLDIRLAEVSSS